MDTLPCSTSSRCLWKQGTQHPAFYMQFENQPWQKWHGVDHKVPRKKCQNLLQKSLYTQWRCGTLHQQCIFLIVAHQPLSLPERVPIIWHFDAIWESTLVEMTQCYQQRASEYFQKAPHIYLNYASKEYYEPLEQQCLSLLVAKHRISFAERVPTIWSFVCIRLWESASIEMTQCEQWEAYRCCQKLLKPCWYIKGRLWTTSTTMDVSTHHMEPPFHVLGLGGYPKSSILYIIWESISSEIAQYCIYKGLIDAAKSPSHLPYTS